MSDELSGFLESGVQPPMPGPEPEAEPRQAEGGHGEDTIRAPVELKPAPQDGADTAKGGEGEGEDEIPEARPGERTVPLSALEKTRNDWKTKHAAEKARADELNRQLELARQAPPPPPPFLPPPQQQAPPMEIDPSDPRAVAEFMVRANENARQAIINERLNFSELMLRQEVKDQAEIDRIATEFRAIGQENPALYQRMLQDQHPWKFARDEVEKARVAREVGTDPAGYKARLMEEVRAQLMAEMGQQPQQGQPQAPGPRPSTSLARASSAMPRSASATTGDMSMSDILGGR